MHLNKQIGQKFSSTLGLMALSAVLGGLAPAANAATYYVSTGGSDSYTVAETVNNVAKPYRTIGSALYRAKTYFSTYGVNTIVVEPGVYAEKFSISQNGLTIKARNNATSTTTQRSIIRPSGANVWDVISINAHSVDVQGFEVDGSNAYVDTGHNSAGTGTKATGITSYGNSTNGISINGDHNDSSGNFVPLAYDVSVTRCIIHDMGGGGVNTQNGNYNASANLATGPTGGPDYVTIDDNIIYNCSFWSKYSTSGISLHGNSKLNNNSGFHCYVRRNRIYNNQCKFTGPDFFGEASHTDGNGIILDTCGHQNPSTLIENNIVYKNGGRGINSFRSSNVTLRNNTLYKNCQDPDIVAGTYSGEICVVDAHDTIVSNNITYGVGGSVPVYRVKTTYDYTQAGGTIQNVYIRSCTYWGSGSGSANIPAGVIDWGTTLYGNPYLHAPESGDFTVDIAPTQSGMTQAQSQYVIDRSSTTAGDFATDTVTGAARPATGKDRGAYERSLTSGGSS